MGAFFLSNLVFAQAWDTLWQPAGNQDIKLRPQRQNVGIGVSDPKARLHLHDNNPNAVEIRFTNQSAGKQSTDGFSVGIGATPAGITDPNPSGMGGTGDAYLWQREAQPMHFFTNNLLRMSIAAGGNIGIGLTNPLDRIDLASGTIRIREYADPTLLAGEYNLLLSDPLGRLTLGYKIFKTSNNSCSIILPWVHCPPNYSVANDYCGPPNFGIAHCFTDLCERRGVSIHSEKADEGYDRQGLKLRLDVGGAARFGYAKLGEARENNRGQSVNPNLDYTRIDYDGKNKNGIIDFIRGGAPGGTGPLGKLIINGNTASGLPVDVQIGSNGFASNLILPLGKVGIGTSSPTSDITIVKGSPIISLERSTGDASLKFKLSGSNQEWVMGAETAISSNEFVIRNSTISPPNLGYTFIITQQNNIGIGAINPTAKLDVDGQIKMRGGSPGVGKVLTSDANGLASWQNLPVTPPNGNNNWLLTGNTLSVLGRFIGTHNAYDFVMKTNSIEGMRIKNGGVYAGNVGIGTSNPFAKLTIDVTPTNINNSNNTALNLIVNSNAGGTGSITHALSVFDQYNGANSFVIKKDGATGIGTSNPQERLTIVMPKQSGNAIAVYPNNLAGTQANFIVKGTGQTVIGTTPIPFTSMLDVNGSVRINDTWAAQGRILTCLSNDGLAQWQPAAATGWALSGNGGTTAGNFIGTTDAQDFVIRTNRGTSATQFDAAERMRIAANGASDIRIGISIPVGISPITNQTQAFGVQINVLGTLTTHFMVTNHGFVFGREFIVRHPNDPIPDYVFAEKYVLPDWEVQKKHWQKHHHLLGVPSAKEIEKDGMKMSKLILSNLEKTEQLYLYFDEMKEEMKSMKKEIEFLKKENATLKQNQK